MKESEVEAGAEVASGDFAPGFPPLAESDSEEGQKQDSDYWEKHKRVDKRNQGLGRDPIGADRYLPKKPFSTERNLYETIPMVGGATAVKHDGRRIHISKIVGVRPVALVKGRVLQE